MSTRTWAEHVDIAAAPLRPPRLLIATDHRYHAWNGDVYDTYCFDRKFFDDYQAVFPEVRVAARLRSDKPPKSARRSDGDGVTFVPLRDVRGVRWVVAPVWLYCRPLAEAVEWADAVCIRIPSVAGNHAYRLARAAGKPVMFELIGDPSESLQGSGHGPLHRLFGRIDGARVRRIVRTAAVGSYVSFAHLQARYPAHIAVTDGISSIRLPSEWCRSPRIFRTVADPLEIVLVASFVAVKRHDLLIRAVAVARGLGARLRLHLIGDGPLAPVSQNLVRELGLTSDVVFYGHVSDRAELALLLDKMDLFAMTSSSEGMPRAMIEAMARGVPAVGTNVGGVGELLPEEQLLDPPTPDAIGRTLARLQSDPETLTRFAAHSSAVAQQFDIGLLSQRRQRLLTHLLKAASQ